MADDVLRQACKGISEIISGYGVINVDFADARSVFSEKGFAHMGIGVASGENAALEAAKRAVESPLLEIKISGATELLVNITSNENFTLCDCMEATNYIVGAAGEDANMYFGQVIDPTMEDSVKITVIATGFDDDKPAKVDFSNTARQNPVARPAAPKAQVRGAWETVDVQNVVKKSPESNEANNGKTLPSFMRKQ